MLEVRIFRRLATIDLDVTFSLDSEVLALFGPSGSGKSMTLKMIAGIETPDRGIIRTGDRVLFDDTSRTNLPPQQRNVGYVPQLYALFPHLSALENIAFPLRKARGWSRSRASARATELLSLFGLSALADARPARLSGGQQQRVALARALAGDPEILLLDEPFAALDAPTREELREEFRLIQQRLEIPVLLVTHDLEEAATLGSRMAVIVSGTIQQAGDTRTILDRPSTRHVAELVRARNILPGTVRDAACETPIGSIPACSAHAMADGTAVEVVIRSEAIRVVPPANPPDPSEGNLLLSGTITDLIDHGTRIAVLVDVRGTTLEVNLSPTSARQLDLQTGQPVDVAIRPADVHVIPASGVS